MEDIQEAGQKIYVEYETRVFTDQQPSEPYGSWFRDSETTPTRAYNKKPKSSDYIEFTADFKPGHRVFVVRGVYSQGDSFGHEEGRADFIDVFETIDEAEAFASRVEMHDKLAHGSFWNMTPKKKEEVKRELIEKLGEYLLETPESYHKYALTDGKGRRYHFPWGGYFDNLTEVKVDIVDYIEYKTA